jgi:hypothetical protein
MADSSPKTTGASQVAVVTGGTGALGAAVARRFADAGYDVHVTASREPERGYAGAGRAHVVDLTNLETVRVFAAPCPPPIRAAGRNRTTLRIPSPGFARRARAS